MNEYDDSEFEEKNDNLEFFTRQEVMDLLKLDQRTYHLYINKGILKPYRSSPKSKKFLFKRAEIEQVFKPTITTKIISVINQKGGVGKTTLTHNIGFGFSSRGYKTLLIDSDPQENLSRGLGMPKDMEPEKTLVAIFDKYKKNDAGLEEIVHQLGENLFLIPSSIILSGVETESDINIYFRLKTYIQHIYMDYDFIIIDCPPSLGTLTTNALIASEYVLIPICPDFYSPLGTEQLMKKINETKEYNPSLIKKIRELLLVMIFQLN